MEDAYIINGNNKLSGEVQLSGAKNIALKVLIASLMFDGKVTLSNMPKIKDVEELMDLINLMGGKAEFVDKNIVEVEGAGINTAKIDLFNASKIRVSFMMFAPLLYKKREAHIPNPGGCRIGARSIDRSIELMKAFGVEVKYTEETGYYEAYAKHGIVACEYEFEKPSHTGCELAIMFGAVSKGHTVIKNPSLEPEIDDLIFFLNMSGAKIERINGRIEIEGVEKLKCEKSFIVAPDRNEAVTYAAAAIASRGDVLIKGAKAKELTAFLHELDIVGGGYEIIDENSIRFFYNQPLKFTHIVTAAHPGFMTDWQAPWAVLMTQAEGESTIHETIFENRFGYVDELKKLGAEMDYYHPIVEDPKKTYQFNVGNYSQLRQAIRISGPTDLHNGVLNVSDLRAGASLVIAALIAEGESVINGASIIERGYENLEEKITKLGGNIRKI